MLAHHEPGSKSLGDELPDSHPYDDYHGSHDFIECAVHRAKDHVEVRDCVDYVLLGWVLGPRAADHW